MSLFPTAHSTIYRNEFGEVTGWDDGSYDDGPDPDDFYNSFDEYDDDESDDDSECDGHETLSGAIGDVIFCDGSCKP